MKKNLIALALAALPISGGAFSPPAEASYCIGVEPAYCPYAWTYWEGRWVYSPWKEERQ